MPRLFVALLRLVFLLIIGLIIGLIGAAPSAIAQTTTSPVVPSTAVQPPFLRDRGPGLPISMFGTYIRRGDLIVYPFLEWYVDRDFEYKPSEFGAAGDVDFRGNYRAQEGLVLVAYGLTENVAIEVEMAVIRASFRKAADDASAVAPSIKESGLGDVEGQVRWRWRPETADRPELFSYAELVVPHAKDRVLTGTAGWEAKFGTGAIRGFRWGTLTLRGGV